MTLTYSNYGVTGMLFLRLPVRLVVIAAVGV